jgi:dynein light chain Tctex-type 1
MAEQKALDVVQTQAMIEEEIAGVLGEDKFDAKKVQEWCQQIVQRVLKKLVEINKSQDFQYKYVVNAIVLERTGAGLHSTSSCLWDKASDASSSAQWSNKSMYCICSVWALRCN